MPSFFGWVSCDGAKIGNLRIPALVLRQNPPFGIPFSGSDPAQCRERDSQIRGNIPQLRPPAHVRKLSAESLVAFARRKREALLVRTVQAPVPILVDDPPPVGQLDIRGKELPEVVQTDAIGFDLLESFDKLLARLSIILLAVAYFSHGRLFLTTRTDPFRPNWSIAWRTISLLNYLY